MNRAQRRAAKSKRSHPRATSIRRSDGVQVLSPDMIISALLKPAAYTANHRPQPGYHRNRPIRRSH